MIRKEHQKTSHKFNGTLLLALLRVRRGNAFGHISLRVCPVRALTFDLKLYFWYARYMFRTPRSGHGVKIKVVRW